MLLRESDKACCSSDEMVSDSKLEQILVSYKNTVVRLDKNENLFNYWFAKKNKNRELFSLFCVTNAVPMTQVSVERLFSSLKFIFSCLRSNLSPEMVQNILIIRCNNLFTKISEEKKSLSNVSEASDENATINNLFEN